MGIDLTTINLCSRLKRPAPSLRRARDGAMVETPGIATEDPRVTPETPPPAPVTRRGLFGHLEGFCS